MTISIELPDKHIQIIKGLASGLTQKEIAYEMGMTLKNVERIIGILLTQFDLKNSAELVSFAHRKGLIA